jgi:hypothetical protein
MSPKKRAKKGGKLAFLEKRGVQEIGRYRGHYPVTGRYTSRQSAGSTEVASMTIEYLGDPSKAKQMIDKDPVQAAIVLRRLMPNAFKTLPDNLKAYLPHER